MDTHPRTILVYQTAEGKKPFDVWYLKLKDAKTRLVMPETSQPACAWKPW